MPVLNEMPGLQQTLLGLRPLRGNRVELVVVDGGSTDGSREAARYGADQLLDSRPGRAAQMNLGAESSSGELLLFLHADTLLPANALQEVERGLAESGRDWGGFDIRLSGNRWPLRVVEWMMNRRSRWTGIATGDQMMFVRRSAFEQVGGFPDQALMEDLVLSKRLKALSRPLCLPGPVISSSRRWEQHGVLRTIFLMWKLRLAWFLGADVDRLARRYRKSAIVATGCD
jgi:rSAM/selenodomain-associated transferase 2